MCLFNHTGSVGLIGELFLNAFMIRFETRFGRIYEFVYSQLLKALGVRASGDWQGC